MSTAPDLIVVGLRAISFVAAAQAAGLAIFFGLFGAELNVSKQALSAWTCRSAVFAILLVLCLHVLEPARLTASFAAVWDGSLHRILLASDAGAARAVRIAGLVAIVWSARSGSRLRAQLGLVGAVVTAGSFLLMGHTAAAGERWVLSVLLLLHVLVVAFWFGSLIGIWLCSNRERIATVGAIIGEFSSLAGWAVPVILVAGIAMAGILLPSFAAIASPYGLLLVAKIVAFILLMTIAARNKFWLGPAVAQGSADALTALRHAVAVELSIITVVLALTAVMTGLFGPE